MWEILSLVLAVAFGLSLWFYRRRRRDYFNEGYVKGYYRGLKDGQKINE